MSDDATSIAAVRPRAPHPLPDAQQALLRRAERLCWWSLLALGAVAAMMYAVMGGSQAMKTALAEDLLSLLPPAAFLVAARFRRKAADAEYVNGRERAFDIAFLAASVALAGVGLLLVFDGVHTLIVRAHPVIGTVELGGQVVWKGWLMIAALAVSAVPPVILGHMKLKLARQLELKPLHTDADMNKADWLTALAGIAGVAGIGFGLWWADAAAAIFIAVEVLRDGARNLRNAIRDHHDARPQQVDRSDDDPLVAAVRDAVAALPWVRGCRLRLHEEGLRLCGVVWLEPDADGLTPQRRREAEAAARGVHWRIAEVTATAADPGDADAAERAA
ncbi:cation transporter [Luteimonas sp. Y-2-2-4F]|nr:cation transporter [Luteimonas sp. Y-2-2-4F]MCD9033657.1 cation transporter [Luteimonas sp. Y-2-2-4F]